MELLCHYMAQKLCAAAGKKYWFCNDYDVEMVDFDPDTGEVRKFQRGTLHLRSLKFSVLV